jgi:hypothetical protein
MNILSENDTRRDIALHYLTLAARDLIAAQGDIAQAVNAMRVLKHYIGLAEKYGCTDREMRFALGFSEQKWNGVR